MKASLVIICAVLSVIMIGCGEKYEIKLNLEPGETYKMHSRVHNDINQEIMGQQMDMKSTMTNNISFNVIERQDDGSYILEMVFDYLSMNMEMPFGTMEASSDREDEEDLISSMLARYIDQPHSVHISSRGEILDVEDMTYLFADFIENIEDLTSEQKQGLQQEFESNFGLDAMRSGIEVSTAIYPDRKVGVGDTWNIQTRLETIFDADFKSTFTLKEVRSDYFLITATSEIETLEADQQNLPAMLDGVEVEYDIKGGMESEIKVDRVTGWVIEAMHIQDMSGEFGIKDSPMAPGGMTVPISFVQRIDVNKD